MASATSVPVAIRLRRVAFGFRQGIGAPVLLFPLASILKAGTAWRESTSRLARTYSGIAISQHCGFDRVRRAQHQHVGHGAEAGQTLIG